MSSTAVNHKSTIVIPLQHKPTTYIHHTNHKEHNNNDDYKSQFRQFFQNGYLQNRVYVSNEHLINNWRNRYRRNLLKQPPNSATVQSLQNQVDIEIGREPLLAGLDDSRTIPIGSDYLSQFIDHWTPFSSWTLIRPSPFSSDIVQGLLGNCWFLSALALVAERTELLRKILPTSVREFEQTRRATVRLFKQGRWHSVLVDDVLPVNRQGQLVFSQAKRNQLFVPLIEKALAKLYGGYDHLRGGLTSEGMTSLTGFPCEILWLPPNRRLNPEQVQLTTQELRTQMDEYWIKMISYNSAGFLMGASCGRNSNPDLGSAADYRQRGLLKEHAYSVLDVVCAGDLRLVKLRNPWGTLVWRGDWSDRSPLWNSRLRRELVPEGAEEGIFWISFEDLCRYFEMAIVCKIQTNWYKYGFEGRFPASLSDPSNWTVYELKMDDRYIHEAACTQAELSATLYQDNTANKLAVFVVVFELLNSNSSPVIGPLAGSSICNIQSAVTCECELRRGKRYLLGIFGFNNWHNPSIQDSPSNHGYVLRLHSSKPIQIETFTPNSILLGDMITYYVKASGKPIHRPNVVTYQLNNDWAGLISVVENRDSNLWLQVSMKTCLKPSIDPNELSISNPNSESPNFYSTTESVSFSHNVIRSEDVNGHDQTQLCVTNLEDNNLKATTDPSTKCDSNKDDNTNHDLHYLASTRNTLSTRDLIPPGHCQLINVITNQRPITAQHISIKLNFRFQSFEQWFKQKLAKSKSTKKFHWEMNTPCTKELFHQPTINDSSGFIYGFHCPRSNGANL